MGTILTIIIAIIVIWFITQLAAGVIGLLIWLFVAGLAGYFASRITGGDGAGTGMNILLGLVGGLVGPMLLGLINMDGLRNLPFLGGLVVSLVGAVVVIFVARFFNKNFAK